MLPHRSPNRFRCLRYAEPSPRQPGRTPRCAPARRAEETNPLGQATTRTNGAPPSRPTAFLVASGDLRPAANRGPILTVANWSGQPPGLVGMLNLDGSLTKAGVRHSTLWSVDFEDALFASGPRRLRRAQRPCAPARSRGSTGAVAGNAAATVDVRAHGRRTMRSPPSPSGRVRPRPRSPGRPSRRPGWCCRRAIAADADGAVTTTAAAKGTDRLGDIMDVARIRRHAARVIAAATALGNLGRADVALRRLRPGRPHPTGRLPRLARGDHARTRPSPARVRRGGEPGRPCHRRRRRAAPDPVPRGLHHDARQPHGVPTTAPETTTGRTPRTRSPPHTCACQGRVGVSLPAGSG